MIILHTHHELPETRHSRELNRRVDQVIRDYMRENPDISTTEVRAALLQATPGGETVDVVRRKKAVMVGVAAAAMGAFTAIANAGGKFNSQTWLLVCGIVAAAAAVAFAIIRLARRA